jgi:hypothetical protein
MKTMNKLKLFSLLILSLIVCKSFANIDYQPQTIILKIKPEFMEFCKSNKIEIEDVQQIFTDIQVFEIKKIFPHHQPLAIKKAKKVQADIIIPVVHWGVEYQRHENKEQQLLASFLARKGCDAIVGMHPHVIQPIKTVKNADGKEIPVAYSLGNFVSNQRERFKDGGIMFKLTIVSNKNTKTDQSQQDGQIDKIRSKTKNTATSINHSSTVKVIEYSHLPFWIHKVKPFEGDPNFGKGYWMLTEKELPLLQGEALSNAKQFFEDTRELLSK